MIPIGFAQSRPAREPIPPRGDVVSRERRCCREGALLRDD